MKWFLLITFLALESIVSINGIPACGPNQDYFECGPCEQICDREPQSCIAACRKPGCYCQQGKIRASPCNSSECVLPSNCPGQCGVNEVYSSCGGCDQICNEEPIFCTQDCSRPGCYCRKGYKRAAKGQSGCIPESKCQQNQCRVNEEYKCGCEQYCNEPIISCFRCTNGCYCKYGFKRSFPGGLCISISICPLLQGIGRPPTQNTGPSEQGGGSSLTKNKGEQQRCGVNEVYKYCNGCDQYCNKLPVLCRSFICKPGCYCQDGFKRSFRGGICISISVCPRYQNKGSYLTQSTGSRAENKDSSLTRNTGQQQRCGLNEVFIVCGGCDGYCNAGPIACAECQPDCYCRYGCVRLSPGGRCVPRSSCQRRCAANEVFKNCGGCDQYCNRGPVSCAAVCSPGCYCKDDYKRSPEGKCVRTSTCEPQQQQCNKNEVFQYCGGCDQYCNEKPKICTSLACIPGCYCQKGCKRSFRGGICIPTSVCPGPQVGEEYFDKEDDTQTEIQEKFLNEETAYQCGENEVYNQCGVGKQCEDYCGRGANACAYCQPGCYCERGYTRSGPEYGAICIPQNQCPRAKDSSLTQKRGQQQRCELNEVYLVCGGCDGYCNAGPIACAKCLPDCYCINGYVRLSPGGRCVPRSSCPRKCKANEVFKNCGGCDQYCNRGPVSCAAVCSPGCYCKDDYKRSPGGSCVLTSSCPQAGVGEDSFVEEEDTQTQVQEQSFNEETDSQSQVVDESVPVEAAYRCGENEVYNQCGVGKQCEDYCGRGANACAYCQPGCYCERGYTRNGPEYGAICIPQNQCPLNQDVGLSEIEETGGSSSGSRGFESSNSGSRYEDIVTYEIDETDESFSDWSEFERSYSGSRYEDTMQYETEETYESYGDRSEYKSSNSGSRSEYGSLSFVENAGPRAEEDGASFAGDAAYVCGENEVYNRCGVGKGCEDYCFRGANACAYCQPGCYCMPSYVREGPESNAKCIRKTQCSTAQKCFANEVYSNCGTACPATCENRNPVCTKNCVAGCICKKGYIRRHADVQTKHYECIPENQCPS